MNADILKGKWKEIKGEVKVKWGKLTDDDITQIEGQEEKLLGLLEEIRIQQRSSGKRIQSIHRARWKVSTVPAISRLNFL